MAPPHTYRETDVRCARRGEWLSSVVSGLALGVLLALAVPAGEAYSQVAFAPQVEPYFVALPLNAQSGDMLSLETAGGARLLGRHDPKAAWAVTVGAYLSDDWDLASGYAQTVASAVARAAHQYQIDPLLLLAIAATESSFKHNIGNPGGGSDPMLPYGIMQVAGRYHRDKFPNGAVVRTNVAENIRIGASVLREYLDLEDGNLRRALRRYNGSNNDRYFQRVNGMRLRFHADLPGAAI